MTSKQQPATAAKKRLPPNAGKGRKAGTPNKTTTALKEAILQAATDCGMDGEGKDGLVGYLGGLARSEPKSFATLLGKVLPMQVTGADGEDLSLKVTVKYVKPSHGG